MAPAKFRVGQLAVEDFPDQVDRDGVDRSVMGPVDVRIPREELSGLIDPRGALTDPAEG